MGKSSAGNQREPGIERDSKGQVLNVIVRQKGKYFKMVSVIKLY